MPPDRLVWPEWWPDMVKHDCSCSCCCMLNLGAESFLRQSVKSRQRFFKMCHKWVGQVPTSLNGACRKSCLVGFKAPAHQLPQSCATKAATETITTAAVRGSTGGVTAAARALSQTRSARFPFLAMAPWESVPSAREVTPSGLPGCLAAWLAVWLPGRQVARLTEVSQERLH